MGKNMLETIAPIALGVGAMALSGGTAAPALAGASSGAGAAGAAGAGLGGAFGSADMIAAGAGGGLLGGGAGAGAAAVPGSIESAGLLDMGGGNMVNPEYFVGEGMGNPLYVGSPDAPFAERAGNLLGNFDMKMDPMKAMNMVGGQPQQQQVARPAAIQRPQMQPATNVPSLYNQTISGGVQLTDEQKRMLMQRLGGQNGLIG